MQDTAHTRRHDLDWVRIGAFALLIVYHVGMYYVTWNWHVKSPFASGAIEPLMMLTSPWRLSLLFVVSGAATAFLLRRGAASFLASRSRRLLIPLVFGMVVIVTPQAYFEVVEKLNYADGYGAFWARYLAFDGRFCPAGQCLKLPTWNHLWFVAYLWVYSVLLWCAMAWAPKLAGRSGATLARACRGWGVLLWPIVFFAVARMTLVGRFPSTHALLGDWYNHALYASAFVLGFVFARHDAAWSSLQRARWVSLALAVASYGFLVWYFFFQPSSVPVPDAWRIFQRVIYAVNQWSAIAAVLGFARQWAPGDSPARRYLTEAIFPFYVVHQTAIVVLAHELKPVGLSPLVEGPLLIVATFAICVASFEIVRRVAWLRPLFGLAAAKVRSGSPAHRPATQH